MSYILDALRKADAERERGTVPGLYAQPVFDGGAAPSPRRESFPRWAWIALGVVVLLAVVAAAVAAALAWISSAPLPAAGPAAEVAAAQPPTAPAAKTAVQSAAPATPVQAPAASASLSPPPSVPEPGLATNPPRKAGGSAVADSGARQEPTAAPVRRLKSAGLTPPTSKLAKGASPESAASATSVASASTTKGAAPTASSAESRVYKTSELPEDVRRQLPTLAVGASIYSATPANRILIINGQVLHEGESVIKGLVLEQIKLKAAVLAFKGYRFLITY